MDVNTNISKDRTKITSHMTSKTFDSETVKFSQLTLHGLE
jgi:hypothetical protein